MAIKAYRDIEAGEEITVSCISSLFLLVLTTNAIQTSSWASHSRNANL